MSIDFERPAWQARAACKGIDPAEAVYMFFPTRGENKVTARAKAICATCPVKTECLLHALDNDEHYGIWGGTSERERRRLRRIRDGRPVSLVYCGTERGYNIHRRRGEPTCVACRWAHAQIVAVSKASRRESA